MKRQMRFVTADRIKQKRGEDVYVFDIDKEVEVIRKRDKKAALKEAPPPDDSWDTNFIKNSTNIQTPPKLEPFIEVIECPSEELKVET